MSDEGHLTFAVAAGGTAGHVNPALALAEELRSRGHEVHFFGEERRLEGALVPQAGFPFHPVRVTGFDRRRPWTLAPALARLAAEERRLTRAFRVGALPAPDAAIGFGAYLELPLVRAAARLGVPVALHEQNSVPGLANRRSARSASLIAIGQPGARDVLAARAAPGARVVFTGNPVRPGVLAGDRLRGRRAAGVPDDATVLLIFGGSLGARHLNERVAALKGELLSIDGLYVIHSTGAEGHEHAVELLALSDVERRRWIVRPYIDDMGDALAASDLVLSRSGASSVAEIAALAVPAVLVPYPLATADHQTMNARMLSDPGAAIVVADADLDGDSFRDLMLDLLRDSSRRADMARAARGLAQDRAAQKLADELEALTRKASQW